MRKPFAASIYLIITFAVQSHAAAQEKGVSGKWSGTGVNIVGKNEAFLEITENEDGTLTGTWGNTRNEWKIEKGERVTAEILRWESSSETHRLVVQAKVNGKSMVVEYTATMKVDGKIKGGIGTMVLTRE